VLRRELAEAWERGRLDMVGYPVFKTRDIEEVSVWIRSVQMLSSIAGGICCLL
jgi:hypothetical protein